MRAACELLGLDPLAMANEGRMLVICGPNDAPAALQQLQAHDPEARCIGVVGESIDHQDPLGSRHPVSLRNSLGVDRPLELGRGEQLPRIC